MRFLPNHFLHLPAPSLPPPQPQVWSPQQSEAHWSICITGCICTVIHQMSLHAGWAQGHSQCLSACLAISAPHSGLHALLSQNSDTHHQPWAELVCAADQTLGLQSLCLLCATRVCPCLACTHACELAFWVDRPDAEAREGGAAQPPPGSLQAAGLTSTAFYLVAESAPSGWNFFLLGALCDSQGVAQQVACACHDPCPDSGLLDYMGMPWS